MRQKLAETIPIHRFSSFNSLNKMNFSFKFTIKLFVQKTQCFPGYSLRTKFIFDEKRTNEFVRHRIVKVPLKIPNYTTGKKWIVVYNQPTTDSNNGCSKARCSI